MNNYRVNINYAKALFLLAAETNSEERVHDDVGLIGRVCSENRELNVVFANPTIPVKRKLAIMEQLFADHVGPQAMAFLRFVVRQNRAINLKGICEAYLALYREANGIVMSELTTHIEADDALRKAVVLMVSEYTGKQVELREHTDPSMLGGYMLEFDNKMYDARIGTKIRKLRLAFADNEYESKL